MTNQAFICDAVRTPFGRYGGSLSSVRADDLGAVPLRALMERNKNVDWQAVSDVLYGCANQAGEDNRNVARMAALLAGLPHDVPGATINRLCGSSLDAVGTAARAIRSGEAHLVIAGGVESMSRAPFVMPKAESAFARTNAVYDTTIGWRFVNRLCASGLEAVGQAARAIAAGELEVAIAGGVESMSRAPFVMPKATGAFQRANEVHDTTIGWRFVNPAMKAWYGVDSMPETAENVADDFQVARADQDAFAHRSQQRAAKAQERGVFAEEIVGVALPKSKSGSATALVDEHIRADTTLEALAALKPVVRPDGTVTAGNASGVNDGAAAIILASPKAVERLQLRPRARVLGMASAALAPRIMGVGPIESTRKLVERLGLKVADFDVVELNEAFASQALAVLRALGLPDDAEHVNPNGGAIALGHPLGASGARLVITGVRQLEASGGRLGLATMCVGVGQGVSLAFERLA